MPTRKALSKKVRFDVFKRDGFCCQYCGSSPPLVVLEVDHINPVSKGGTNAVDNLVTACFDCNRGKSAVLLEVCPETIAKKAELLEEKREQLKAYERMQKSIERAQGKQIDQLESILADFYPGNSFAPRFKSSVKKHFMPQLPFFVIKDAFELAMSAASRGGAEGAIKYFYAVCWKKIREQAE